MSMLQAFERMLRGPQAEQERRDEQVQLEGTSEEATGPAARCKACGYTGDDVYCPHCLADTMTRIRRPRRR